MSSSSNNEKVIYQVWTDGKGSFAVRKKEMEYEEKVSQFEYSDS
jgi:hypothetical protein